MTNAQAAAISKSEAAVVSAMTNVYFAAQHTLASSLVPDLNRLCVLQGATQLNDLRVYSHTSYEHSCGVSEFQNCMADVLRSDLLQKIQDIIKYSIMIDESTDISVKQNLVTYVRLLETDEFGMAELQRANAESIYENVVNLLGRKGIDIQHLSEILLKLITWRTC
ncbi:uncharacterized protein LOC127841200 [Dreissena polymorpha]|uniref:uncharacterized protein LOC127841200 n=1 Tax=Dreissena polymorpha TaxID=45954 RepID=UPI002263C1C1|nr:uncharacterized protein LOC127841200 [Dreissena polymorpha]